MRLFWFGRLFFHSIFLGLDIGINFILTIIAAVATLDFLLDVDVYLVYEDDSTEGDAEDNAGQLDVGWGVDGRYLFLTFGGHHRAVEHHHE